MAQYPATSSSGTFRVATKADTASVTSLGSGSPTSDNGSADTYGSWVQIVASTSAESYITAVGVYFTTGVAVTVADLPIFVELGTGGAGAETVKWEGMCPFAIQNATVWAGGALVPLTVPFRVTSGKRIAARVKMVGTSTSRQFTVHVFGLPITQTEGN